MAEIETRKVKLDWSRLVIFDQLRTAPGEADRTWRLNDPRITKLGPVKPGKLGKGPGYIPWQDPASH